MLPVNSFLYKFEETNLRMFCMETRKKLLQLFWNCNLVHNVIVVQIYLKVWRNTHPLNTRGIILGKSDEYIEDQNTVNRFVYIYYFG